MAKVRNVLFVMADQLRADYLSAYGHPTLKTPNIDALAARGMRFTRAYVQSPVCGPARMSYYTGRYVTSHGATWNNIPLSVGEWTLGDYVRPLGPRVGLVGKTHMRIDRDGFSRLGLNQDSTAGRYAAECGFEPFARDDGLHPDFIYDPDASYERYLRERGYDGKNLWQDWANSGSDEDGALLSGWYMRNAREPARIPEEHSETAWTTDQAMEFIRVQGDQPWVLHVSYIKPHWPYIVSAPYHDMYGPEDCIPAIRSEAEREDAHPVFKAFMQHPESVLFSEEEVRLTVAPTYMGLIKQIDDHIGRLMQFLEAEGRLDDTLIVFTSDHGDYMGDHWLGEKELFHEQSVRVPLIVVDPSDEAQATRGTVSDALIESIDLVPTFVEAFGRPGRRPAPGGPLAPGFASARRIHPHLARSRGERTRLQLPPGTPRPRLGSERGARLHGCDGSVEVRLLRAPSSAALRLVERPTGARGSRCGSRPPTHAPRYG